MGAQRMGSDPRLGWGQVREGLSEGMDEKRIGLKEEEELTK